jgi:protoheme IX farnesyltransferase
MERDGTVIAIRNVHIGDYVELLKPELTGLSVLTAVCAAILASPASLELRPLLGVVLGTLLVGGGAGGFNQVIERRYDALMKRTERRPVASGRMHPLIATVYSLLLSFVGLVILSVLTTPLAAFIASITLLSYIFVYTPLKRVSPIATLVGGIPGALPPFIGWSAITNDLSVFAFLLFLILFFWQMPHFYSLAWMYRKDYSRAGFQLLPALDERGVRTGYHIVAHTAALIVVTTCAGFLGLTARPSTFLSLCVSGAYLALGVRFLIAAHRTDAESRIKVNRYSRHLFLGSLVYLPALMALLLLDRF